MSRSQKSLGTTRTNSRGRFRARLFGGGGNGLVIQLSALAPRITVFQNGGPAFAVAADDGAAVRDAHRLGGYELVGPLGPETPVYVATS